MILLEVKLTGKFIVNIIKFELCFCKVVLVIKQLRISLFE